MDIISTEGHQTNPWQQNLPFHMINILCLSENVCYIDVKNVQVLSYPDSNQTEMIQTQVQQYVFVYT